MIQRVTIHGDMFKISLCVHRKAIEEIEKFQYNLY